ncbi:copper amine oxidase N-terminal domain-containing protein [Paenibacillus tarimensis]|uniref:copper amine oxidase N-terminal domain-containing protein n=1 Tax=Paenibacillus tarimensis TaxID=416012 RepID=UPI001EEA8642|nr:copper amine oxidase N-terminal domain-containing protein [Paenibacillus tarimensis]MCF2944701.1 copper amine oxidase N-terminal domain-containing protein [Paenibacillus tarimensis]
MKNRTIVGTALLAFTLASGTAYAETPAAEPSQTGTSQTASGTAEAAPAKETAEEPAGKAARAKQKDKQSEKQKVSESEEQKVSENEEQKVSENEEQKAVQSEEGKEKAKQGGAKGLQNAYENVKDKPAGARIAAKLKDKYGIEVAPDAVPAEVAVELEAEGELEAAADVLTEAIQDDITNVENYKKLGKVKNKMGNKGVKTYINGKELASDVPPVVKSGRTLVPFRAIAESLQAEVQWDSKTKTVTVTKNGTEVKVVLGSQTATINGQQVTIDVPGEMNKNRVFVPLRFISEALKANVQWDKETSSAIIVGEEEAAAAEEAQEPTAAEEPAAEETTADQPVTEAPAAEETTTEPSTTETSAETTTQQA